MPGLRLLIIDDDDEIRDSMSALLRGEGFEVESARSGLAALNVLTYGSFQPDAILLDLLMPAMDGAQFLTVAQRHRQWSRIPIIVCSAGTVPEDVARSVFAVLTKPFDLDKLLLLVKRACSPPPATPP